MRRPHLPAAAAIALLALFVAEASRSHEAESAIACPDTSAVTILYRESTAVCPIDAAETALLEFDALAGDVVRIILNTETTLFDPLVEVRDPGNALVDSASCDGGTTTGTTCTVTLGDMVMGQSGTHEISVSDVGADEAGSFRLQIESIPPPLADLFLIDELFFDVDAINVKTDLDFFALSGPFGEQVRISIVALTSIYDPRLEIWDAAGQKLVDTSCDGGTPSGPLPLCSVIEELELGVDQPLFLGVSDLGANEVGTYRVIAEYLPEPAAGAASLSVLAALACLAHRRARAS